ncbi:hypothetical protein [Leptospira vanthielii]|uniref:Uncharacterized protein n=1 Tax=Leptospira vanthielii serovar Holland str. Waz Holland = ATCC 700522 TaxID=1218591 RepID=N1W868_9LEPT|nr:hypothetical protein [Leptospira vanthielii]EMY71208.1 hypothetical protein LEP1GSC199_0622 [Leptospira vanthielii serovar Holland str. Waz Holland = ATCC 700522]
MSNGTFFLARYHKLGLLTNELLEQLVRNAAKINIRENIWTIIDTKIGTDKKYIFGKMVKYAHEGSVTRVDEVKNESIIEIIPELTLASSPFVILPDYSAIAYLHVWNMIEQFTFMRRFEEIIHFSAHRFFAEIELESITNHDEFFIRFNKFNRIVKIKSKINPPNPLFGHLWGPLKDYLKNRNLEQLKIDEESKKNNSIETSNLKSLIELIVARKDLKIVNPNSIPIGDMAVLMSADGYGKSSIVGDIDGKTEVLHTYENSSNFKLDKDSSAESLYVEAKKILDDVEKNRYLDHE